MPLKWAYRMRGVPKHMTRSQVSTGNTEEPVLSRRERVREATLAEIKGIARRHLVEQGTAGVSLRAIAREMGMTAPGLYRYFAGIDDLMVAVQADLYTELAQAVGDADASVAPEDTDGRILASLRAFRRWALDNRAEFSLMFGPRRVPDAALDLTPAIVAGRRFGARFFTLFDRLLAEGRFSLPHEEELSPALRGQLRAFAQTCGFSAPHVSDGALRVLTSCWVRLYGIVCMEVFDHLAFAMDDLEPLFEAELRSVLSEIGVRYRPPRP